MSRNNAPGSDLSGYQDAHTQGQWEAWKSAIASEREQCARLCADTSADYKKHSLDMGYQEHQRVTFAAYSQALADISKAIAGLK